MTSDQILALIPARCQSKGIPGKNIRPFRGIPLLAHSILQARAAGFSDADIVLRMSDPRSRRGGTAMETVDRR